MLLVLLACDGAEVLDSTAPVDPELAEILLEVHPELESLVVARWDQGFEATGHLEYRFATEAWLQTPSRELAVGQTEQLVLGLPYGTEVEVRLVNDFGDGAETGEASTIVNGSLPDGLPVPVLVSGDIERFDGAAPYILGCMNEKPGGWVGGAFWSFVLDRQGRVVWARSTPGNEWTISCRTNIAGDELLLDQSTYWADWDDGQGSQILRMKIDGTVVETLDAPGLHHPFVDLPDGSIVYGKAHGWSETLVRIDADGTTTTIWDCKDFHDAMGVDDECQSNSLWWHEESDSFLFSFFSTSEVVQIDHATGETLHAWGSIPGSWAFEPNESRFSWQHGPTLTEDGNLLLSTETANHETEVREYAIDTDTETLSLLWAFGEGEGVHAETAGEAWRLENGNTLHNYGSAARVREVTPEGEIVWELYWPGRKRLIGHTTFVEDLYALAP